MAKAHRNTTERREELTQRRINQEVRGASLQMQREAKVTQGIRLLTKANDVEGEEKDDLISRGHALINDGISPNLGFTPVPAKPRISVRGLKGRPWMTKKHTESRLHSKDLYEKEQEQKRLREKNVSEKPTNFVYETAETE